MNSAEALLVRVMDVIASRFDKHAVLRGGMVLRVLGCARLTNDVDYIFVPYTSKKDVVDDVMLALASIENTSIRHLLSSWSHELTQGIEHDPFAIFAAFREK